MSALQEVLVHRDSLRLLPQAGAGVRPARERPHHAGGLTRRSGIGAGDVCRGHPARCQDGQGIQALREVGGAQLQEEAAQALLEDEDGSEGRPQARAAYLAIRIVVANDDLNPSM